MVKRILLCLSAAASVILLFFLLFPVLLPFITAWVLAKLLLWSAAHFPFIRMLPLSPAITICLIFYVMVIPVLLFFLWTAFSHDILILIKQFPYWFSLFSTELRTSFNELAEPVMYHIRSFSERTGILLHSGSDHSGSGTLVNDLIVRISAVAGAVLSSFSSLIVSSFMTVIATYYFIREREALINWHHRLRHPVVDHLLCFKKDFSKAAVSYLSAQILMSGITMTICLLFFLLLHIPYAPVLALTAAVLDMTPLIGTAVLFFPWALYALMTHNPVLAVWLLVIYVVTMAVRQFAEPAILGNRLHIHPFTALIVLFVCFKLTGFFAFLLSPLLLIIVSSLRSSSLLPAVYGYIKKGSWTA